MVMALEMLYGRLGFPHWHVVQISCEQDYYEQSFLLYIH